MVTTESLISGYIILSGAYQRECPFIDFQLELVRVGTLAKRHPIGNFAKSIIESVTWQSI